MVPHKPIDPEREKPDIDNLFSDDSADDLFITRSLKTLPSVEVPSAFLPNVMFQVYEYHHREKIRPAAVTWICLVLLFLCLALFSWDVMDHMKDSELPTFGAALAYKMDQIHKSSAETASAGAGILISSWQMVYGAAGIFLRDTPLTIQLITLAGILALIFLARRYLGRLE